MRFYRKPSQICIEKTKSLTFTVGLETVKCSTLPLECINHIHSSDGLPPRVLSISHGIPNYVLKEVPQNSSDFLIDVTADTLDTASSGETSNGGFGDTLDVLTHNLTVPLCTALTETFTTLSSSGHEMK